MTDLNTRIAAVAAYHMARFNSNLGYDSAKAAFERIERVTGVSAATVKTSLRDSFDHYFPWRAGWDLRHDDKRMKWDYYELGDVFTSCNGFSEEQLRGILQVFGIHA